MTYLVGEAVKMRSEIDLDDVESTTLTLHSLIDPDGIELANSEELEFGSDDEANIGTLTWQSSSSNVPGRYKYVIKALNGIRESFKEGYFYLKAI